MGTALPATGSAQLPTLHSTSTGQLSPAEKRLAPVDPATLRNELTACLALVAPAGMDQDGRKEWLQAAGLTLAGIPADLLRIGCTIARRKCDHPSKIVPAILQEAEVFWQQRKRELGQERERAVPAIKAPEPQYVSPAEAAAIIDEAGLRTDRASTAVPRVDGPARAPTEDELRALFPGLKRDDGTPAADIKGLSIDQIFAQRDRRRAERARGEAAADERRRTARQAGEGVPDELDEIDRYVA